MDIVQSLSSSESGLRDKTSAESMYSIDSEHKDSCDPSFDSLDEPFVKPGYRSSELIRKRAGLFAATTDTVCQAVLRWRFLLISSLRHACLYGRIPLQMTLLIL